MVTLTAAPEGGATWSGLRYYQRMAPLHVDLTRQLILYFAINRPSFLEENRIVATAGKQNNARLLPGRQKNVFTNIGINMEVS